MIPGFSASGTLLCPHCTGDRLHQERLTAFSPQREDADIGRKVTVDQRPGNLGVTVERDCAGNPSPRRQGLVIGFRCEICGQVCDLSVCQHKGQTFIEWKP